VTPGNALPPDENATAATQADIDLDDGPRAPRLGPRQYLAPYMTRTGRFARIDPLASHEPSGLRLLGVAGWATFLGIAWWRAMRRDRTEAG
jgi:hypothetical protein